MDKHLTIYQYIAISVIIVGILILIYVILAAIREFSSTYNARIKIMNEDVGFTGNKKDLINKYIIPFCFAWIKMHIKISILIIVIITTFYFLFF